MNYNNIGRDQHHVIACKVKDGYIYMFNAHGHMRNKESDKLAVEMIKKFIKYHFKSSVSESRLNALRIVHYNGKNLQQLNSTGVCVGFARNFLIKVNPTYPSTYNNKVQRTLQHDEKSIKQMNQNLMKI